MVQAVVEAQENELSKSTPAW